MLKLRDEVGTLTKVAEMLEREELERIDYNERNAVKGNKFNMSVACLNKECGTVACIGGTAYLLENPNKFAAAQAYVNNHDTEADAGIDALYFPSSYSGLKGVDDGTFIVYDFITPAEAAKAIRRYLAGEKQFWDHVTISEDSDG